METMKTKMALGDILFDECITNLNVESKNGTEIYFNGELLEYWDYLSIEFEEPFKASKDEEIDGVLIFGDGTIEFHLKSCESLNWGDFNDDIVREIIKKIMKLNYKNLA
jgi:hypothetical protein